MDDSLPPSPAEKIFPPVHPDESGQKLLNFLQRRLRLPESLLHRWLRTGQIRLNGGRCKPFERVMEGDIVRLPPFALKIATDAVESMESVPAPGQLVFLPHEGGRDDILAVNKPRGLPTHGGSGHGDSVAARLKSVFSMRPFLPTPAHRLDRDTSGTLLVAASYQALRDIQEALRAGALRKEYVAWVEGEWAWRQPVLLRNWLRRDDGVVRVCSPHSIGAQEALCVAAPCRVERRRSLVQILLLTGRKHQIRTQMAARGHILLGDDRYGGEPGAKLRLHALRATLPGVFDFFCPPPWSGEFAVEYAPPPLCEGMVRAEILNLPAP